MPAARKDRTRYPQDAHSIHSTEGSRKTAVVLVRTISGMRMPRQTMGRTRPRLALDAAIKASNVSRIRSGSRMARRLKTKQNGLTASRVAATAGARELRCDARDSVTEILRTNT